MHVGLLFTQRSLHEAGKEGLPELDWQAALVPTSLLTFFVVFYVSNCYARFYELFGCCVGISGSHPDLPTQLACRRESCC